MAISPERKAKMIIETHETAVALMEDLSYIRSVITSERFDAGEIRRLSNLARRIIVNSELKTVASPRMGRLKIVAPQNIAFYRMQEKEPFAFFASGGVEICGVRLRGQMILPRVLNAIPDGLSGTGTVDLTIDQFADQKTLCFLNQWYSRTKIIKYVANIASGVHSSSPKTDDDRMLARVRSCVTFGLTPEVGKINFELYKIDDENPSFKYVNDRIDAVLYETLASLAHLINSPDVKELESIISAEL